MKINKSLFLVILGLLLAIAARAEDHGDGPFTAPEYNAGE